MLSKIQEDKEKNKNMGRSNMELAGDLVRSNSNGIQGRDDQMEYVEKVM